MELITHLAKWLFKNKTYKAILFKLFILFVILTSPFIIIKECNRITQLNSNFIKEFNYNNDKNPRFVINNLPCYITIKDKEPQNWVEIPYNNGTIQKEVIFEHHNKKCLKQHQNEYIQQHKKFNFLSVILNICKYSLIEELLFILLVFAIFTF